MPMRDSLLQSLSLEQKTWGQKHEVKSFKTISLCVNKRHDQNQCYKLNQPCKPKSPLNPNFQHLAPMSYLCIANTVDGAVFPKHSGSRGRERGIILIAGSLLDGHQAKSAGAVIGFQFYRVSAVNNWGQSKVKK